MLQRTCTGALAGPRELTGNTGKFSTQLEVGKLDLPWLRAWYLTVGLGLANSVSTFKSSVTHH